MGTNTWGSLKTDWTGNTEAVYKKEQSRVYFLRSLFHQSVVASAILFATGSVWQTPL